MAKDKNVNPPQGLPIIGELTDKDKKIIDIASKNAVENMIKKVEPILNQIGQMVDGSLHRIDTLESVFKVFPDTVNVVIKHEYPDLGSAKQAEPITVEADVVEEKEKK